MCPRRKMMCPHLRVAHRYRAAGLRLLLLLRQLRRTRVARVRVQALSQARTLVREVVAVVLPLGMVVDKAETELRRRARLEVGLLVSCVALGGRRNERTMRMHRERYRLLLL